MVAKKFMFLAFILCCSVFAQENPSTQDKSSAMQALEIQKQNNTWRSIKGNFANQNEFFNIAQQGFEKHFRKYSPQVFSRSDESLVMVANYKKHIIKSTFFIDSESQRIVIMETDWLKEKIKWINNLVKQVEKMGK